MRQPYSRKKKFLILASALALMIAGMLAMTIMLTRYTPPAYQAWQHHLQTASPTQLRDQADQIESLLLGDLLLSLQTADVDGDHASADELASRSSSADWQTHVKVKDMGVDDQGRPIRSIRLRPQEINTWLTANFESWLEYRDFHLPEQVHSPMVSMQGSVSTLYFTVGTGSVSQVFQADFKINLDEQGMAGLALNNLRAGGMPIPMDSLGQLASKTAGDAGDNRVGEWVAKMQNVRFKPVVKLPDGLKGHLLDYQLQPDNSVILTMRIERYRPSQRKKQQEVAQAGAS